MRKGLIIVVLFFCIWLNFIGCTSQEDKKKEGANTVRPRPAVEAAAVTVSDISQGIDCVGVLSPRFETDVKSENLGMVTEVYVTEWVKVKKGMPLARLDTRETDTAIKKLHAAVELARANLLEAEAASGRAERESERSRNLKEYGLITQQNLDDAQTAKAAAQARVSAAIAQLMAAEEDLRQGETHLAKAVIRAPMDGVIALRTVNVGDLVGEVGTPRVMFKIVDNRLLDLIVNVPSHETEALKVGQSLVFSTDAFPGKTFRGRVKFINPAVNELDRSVKVVTEVPNVPEVLKGGLFVQGRIITNQRQKAIQVPRSALTAWDIAGKRGEVFIVENGAARRRQVQTGIAAGDMVEIRQGLSVGDRIILRGSFSVKDGEPVNLISNQGGR